MRPTTRLGAVLGPSAEGRVLEAMFLGSTLAEARRSTLAEARRARAEAARSHWQPLADIGTKVDEMLVNYEKTLLTHEAARSLWHLEAQGSAVKLENAEINLLNVMKALAYQSLMKFPKGTAGEHGILQVFGGDCSRIAEFRQLITATTLSDKNWDDPRCTQCTGAIDAIEAIIRENGQGDSLKIAQDHAVHTWFRTQRRERVRSSLRQ